MDERRQERRFVAALATLVLAGAALRGAALFTELDFDEVISLELARQARGPLDILGDTLDNNHVLNTLYLWAVGPGHAWPLYRLLSWVTGTAVIAVAALSNRRAGDRAALLTAGLCAGSFVLVTYGSEARGYAPAMLCALVLWEAATRALEGGWGPRLLFWAATALGVLCQPTFALAFLGVASWAAWRLWRSAGTPLARGGRMAALLLPPASLLALSYLRGLQIMGGPQSSWGAVVRGAASVTLGGPWFGAGDWVGAGLLALLLAYALRGMAQRGEDAWVAILVTTVAAPAGVMAVMSLKILAVRYFAVGVPFVYVALGRALARALEAGPLPRRIGLGLLGAFVAANLAQTALLVERGRGHYLEAVRFIAERTDGPEMRVMGDHDKRTETMLRFYMPYVSPPKRLSYVRGTSLEHAEWALFHSLQPDVAAAPGRLSVEGEPYLHAGTFPHWGLSGWTWYLYRKEASTP